MTRAYKKSSINELPSQKQILDFIASSPQAAGKREIARAFGLKGQAKIGLKALLKDMADEGLIDSSPGRAFHLMGGLPKVTILKIIDSDEDGYAIGEPENWQAEDRPRPRVRLIEQKRKGALGSGDRVLARTEQIDQRWQAHILRKLAPAEAGMLGIVRVEDDKLWLQSVDKKVKKTWPISDVGDAHIGDLVLAEKAGRAPRITARVTQRLGDPFQPKSFSLIAIHKYNIPDRFSKDILDEAEKVAHLELGDREDLTHLPIIAIDPADARDHDDAVWATPDPDPSNQGGYQAVVAIADVSFYVRPGSSLDKEARKRGNSVYFPDQVVPMLPERLSGDVCSLKEKVDRAALVCHLVIGPEGKLKSWRFTRAKVRLAANISYEDAQAAIDGRLENPLTETALKPLWDCWQVLNKARNKRQPLGLDLPERRVILGDDGQILSVAVRERLEAHQLIEDFMIAANIAAAKALEAKKAPVMYRVHEPPSREKLVALRDYLKSFAIPFALGQVIKPEVFNHLINRLEVDEESRARIMEQILRSQTQAYYSPANMGHFGLALGSYAHFTSPIRRYADLLVHRALVGAYGLEKGKPKLKTEQSASAIPTVTALPLQDAENMPVIGEKISHAERRAMEAERETVDRYIAAYFSKYIGEIMPTRITGVREFGFFATIPSLGGDGLVPVSTLGLEYFRYEEVSQSLEGEQSGTRYEIGQKIDLRLMEADPISGALRFELPEAIKPVKMSRRGKGRGGIDPRL
ncbi:MAG: VacB/RNase II family 3'-5' exoribonuclease, partial [Zymomonas mobilis subsp. pomaceae]